MMRERAEKSRDQSKMISATLGMRRESFTIES
jgi:hypothetical protein